MELDEAEAMEEAEEEEEEDLLATLESAAAAEPQPVQQQQQQAPLPPAVDIETPEISIAHVLAQYHTTVVPHLREVQSTFEQARQQQRALAAAAESMLDASSSTSSRQGHQQFIDKLRDLQATQDLLVALVEMAHVQMRRLLNNEIYNHMSRGPQTAPFRATESIEPTEIAFKIDNPELGLAQKQDAPAVVTRRPSFFM